MTALMIALGAMVGAPARYLTDRAVQTRHGSGFPWGILSVNVAASLLLGGVTGAAAHIAPAIMALVGSGFCGALSTYSTFGYDVMRLTDQGARLQAVLNVAVSLVAGIGAAAMGVAVGNALAR